MIQEGVTINFTLGATVIGMSLQWQKFDPLDPSRSLSMSPGEFREGFLYGIPLCNSVTGERISDTFYRDKILAAQQQIEDTCNIKIFPQVIYESRDFIREEFFQWGYIRVSWPIKQICRLVGSINDPNLPGASPGITYPPEWLSVKMDNPNDNQYWRNLYIVPNGKNIATFDNLTAISSQYFTFYGARIIPQYWKLWYVTGFDRVPENIRNLIGMIAAVNILPQLGNVVGGVTAGTFGAASSSLSLDSLSQSSSRASNGNIFAERMKQYREMIEKELTLIKGTYKGITFAVC